MGEVRAAAAPRPEGAGKNWDFRSVMYHGVEEFADAARKAIAGLLGVPTESVGAPEVDLFPEPKSGMTASVLFIGTAFGEFVLYAEPETARKLFPDAEGDEQRCEAMAEILNIAAGQCVVALSEVYEKITITAPRVYFGHVRLPKVRSGRVILKTAAGDVACVLCIDQMKLDIAQSYREVIGALASANQELKQANETLKTQQAQLVHSEKMASLGVMAAGVAHEINNPLAFVLGNIEVLQGYVKALGTVVEAYDRFADLAMSDGSSRLSSTLQQLQRTRKEEDIDFVLSDTSQLIAQSRDGLSRIKSIVSGLRKFSRMDDDRPALVRINPEIEDTLAMVANQLKYNAQVEKDLRSTQDVECLAGQISQVLANLLINASQAMPGPGGRIRVSSWDEGDSVFVRVADNGVGIAEENLKKLFTPFFTTKPVGEGTGLGLAISYGIIRQHGGDVTVRSKLNEGTEFTIRLPRRMARAA